MAPEQIYRVTDVPETPAAEQRRRMHKYLWQMAVRFVCIFIAVLTHGLVAWLAIAAAIVLPYTAVIFANAGRRRTGPALTRGELPSAPAQPLNPPGPIEEP